MTEIGARIRELRIARGMTQEDLGKLVGLQKSAIAKYELGRISLLNTVTLSRFCTALNVDMDALLGRGEPIILRAPTSAPRKPVNLIGVVRISEEAEQELHRLSAETGLSLKAVASELIVQAAKICTIERR